LLLNRGRLPHVPLHELDHWTPAAPDLHPQPLSTILPSGDQQQKYIHKLQAMAGNSRYHSKWKRQWWQGNAEAATGSRRS
jgi:hypothetical protein